MNEKESLQIEAKQIGKDIRYLIFSVLAVALFMLTCTLIYSLFR